MLNEVAAVLCWNLCQQVLIELKNLNTLSSILCLEVKSQQLYTWGTFSVLFRLLACDLLLIV